MTLHWWMHWFWITLMILSVCLCDPISSRLDGGLNDNLEHDPAAVVTSEMPAVYQNPRTGKAIGYSPKAILPTTYPTTAPYQKVSLIFPLPTSSDLGDDVASLQRELPHRIDSKKVVDTNINNKTNITSTTAVTPVEKIKTATETILKIVPIINQTSQNTIRTSPNSTIKPPEENRLIKNITQPNKNSTEPLITENKKLNESAVVENTTNISDKNITILEQTTSAPVEAIKNESINVIEEEIEVSTVRALSLETAVGRRAIENPLSPAVIITPDEDAPGLDAAAVSGICFGTLVLLALTGAISFVLYRRRYLNKPQTLNDKCSNPDSSGYIDDSTIRENSEEMYSLDNDSFLNSLEAMTIQNYWTDSVKHTKL